MKKKEETILNLKSLENSKDLKSFLGAIQYMAKFLQKFLEQPDQLRYVLQKR